ncbi:hypothetical protein RRG08_036431 [Elysia crispata]|uniref:Oligomycin sensitivity conferral protein n=1 Tax=Elysia crispata TaxID=231223 RepID=A0AAE0ZKG0_9GAST|nr:hypothetical protein RRG08_036431 [Elysia crispata]
MDINFNVETAQCSSCCLNKTVSIKHSSYDEALLLSTHGPCGVVATLPDRQHSQVRMARGALTHLKSAKIVTFPERNFANMATNQLGQLVRHFSSSAARAAKLVQPPVQVFGVEGRYASALYSAASKQSKLDAVEKELSTLQSDIQKDRRLLEFLSDPSQKRSEKKAAVQNMMKQRKCTDLTTNLFVTLADNGRINKTPQVLSSFSKIMSAHRGEVVCSVVTAKVLDEASMKELRAALQAFLKKGQTLQLQTEVDPSLIGGMKVTIGDRYVDMSMASKIKTYTNLIKQAV